MNTVLNEQAHTQLARQRLQHSRRLATGLLLLAAILFVLASRYQGQYPVLGYLKAFSEAAMVGALADWFAVTALFRRPLGLPIPHTAILPRKQARIADELGHFMAHNFLHGKSIALQAYRMHIANKLLAWLMKSEIKALWLPWLCAQMPLLLRVVKPDQAADFVSRCWANQYHGAKLGVALADVLVMAQRQNLDRRVMRMLISRCRCCLQDKNIQAQLESYFLLWASQKNHVAPSHWNKVKASFKASLVGHVDGWVAAKVLGWLDHYLADALADDEHHLWQFYQAQWARIDVDLRHNTAWHQWLENQQQQSIHSETLHVYVAQIWLNWCQWTEADIHKGAASVWQRQLDSILNHLYTQALQHPQFMRRMNVRMAWWIKWFVVQYQHQGAHFVAEKVKSWDSQQMVDKLELSVGRDLQFIRINGTLVGGVAGLLIYIVGQYI